MKEHSQSRHHRRLIRLPASPYTQLGAYCVTLVTDHRRQPFGQVQKGVMRLSQMGAVVEACWREIPASDPIPSARL